MKDIHQTIRNILQGAVMGVAEVIPGISGSTLALIMGIYDDFLILLHDISEIVKEFLKLFIGKSSVSDLKKLLKKPDIAFGVKLFVGMLITVLVFSNILTFLLDNYPRELFAVFFGVMLVSVQVPFKRIKKAGSKEYGIILLTTIIFFFIFGLDGVGQKETAPYWYIFVGGVIGISGMVLPGVSGSFLLFLIGIYELIVNAVANITKLNFSVEPNPVVVLTVFSAGVLTGFSIFIRVLKYTIEKYPNYVMAFVTGLIIASLRAVWPFESDTSTPEIALQIALITISAILVGIFISRSKPHHELKNITE